MGQSGAVAICASMKSAKRSPRIAGIGAQSMKETSGHGAVCPPATAATCGIAWRFRQVHVAYLQGYN
jgi:hypothetical protein